MGRLDSSEIHRSMANCPEATGISWECAPVGTARRGRPLRQDDQVDPDYDLRLVLIFVTVPMARYFSRRLSWMDSRRSYRRLSFRGRARAIAYAVIKGNATVLSR